jgi:uncharacterized iron-regulated protein
MNFNSHLNNALGQSGQNSTLTPEDIRSLSHYPSLDKLFQDKDLAALNELKRKLLTTFQNLERVVLRGSENDSKQAKISASAVKTALDFLAMLEQSRNNQL